MAARSDVSMFSDSLDVRGTVSVNNAALMPSVLTRRVYCHVVVEGV